MSLNADPTTTSPSEWSYVSEGGATIVFSYNGTHPAFTRNVLRLRKASLAQLSAQPNPDKENVEEPDDPSIAFLTKVTSLLIPSIHLPRLESVPVSGPWLKELASLAEDSRPALRRAKDGIDISRKKAVLATDLVGGKGWAVEIKPKWAFLSNPTYASDETRDIKSRYCRFCMHSNHKASSGEAAAVGYCPLDLFSGDKDRISKALTSLWNAWYENDGHINNLKIFVSGVLIGPSQAGELLVPLLNPSLVENSKDLLPDFIQALMPLLYETTLLPKMATLQRTLDALDIEGLVKLWNAHHPGDSSPIGTNAPDPDLKEWIQFTEEYLKSNGGQDYEITDLGAMDEARLRFYILCYLMSATFKDCSVILRLDSGMPDSITAIDLDPKAIDRLKKWEAQDREIVLGFKEGLASGEITQAPCTDAKVEASLTM